MSIANSQSQLDKAALNVFDTLKKVATDNSVGGNLKSEGPFRRLFEPVEGNNNVKDLMNTFDRSSLEASWKSIVGQESYVPYEAMKLAVQHDFVAQMHRDIQHRYTGRIHRMLHENARKEYHSADRDGTFANMQVGMINFMGLSGTSSST